MNKKKGSIQDHDKAVQSTACYMLREESFTPKICLKVRQESLTVYGLEAAKAFELVPQFEKIRA